MADLTHGAVDSLLGVLSAAIKDEAQLLSGVEGDIQFIRDEMDSMNGFLLHLTKSGDDHDDQQRAWMKQVRDIAYIAQDCIQLYMRITPSHKGFWGYVRHVPVLLKTWWPRRRLANRLRDLKVRVRDVGERRQRYGVTVPEAKKGNKPAAVLQGAKGAADEARAAFLLALASLGMNAFLEALLASVAMDDDDGAGAEKNIAIVITLLPEDLRSDKTLIEDLQAVVLRHGDNATISMVMEMLLRALHVSPQGQGRVSKEEVKNLVVAASSSSSGAGADLDLPKQVMLLCYSKLSRDYKSCLQYVTAFHEEKSISRTSLVRQWAAERRVVKEEKQSYEEAAEMCFAEFLFRGFVYPVEHGAAGNKVKSCRMRDEVKNFVDGISKSENFEGSRLPPHLDNQFRIRRMVAKQEKKLEKEKAEGASGGSSAGSLNICGVSLPRKQQQGQDGKSPVSAASSKKLEKSIDKQLKHFRSLPETYQVNVMDLGGCKGLKKRHLKSICKLQTLKYLSLRKTDVPDLPHQINALQLLETLDIRQTNIRPSCRKRINNLRKLKHLLAGDINHSSCDGSTVRMPTNISKMTDMEVLSCVQIYRGSELSELENLKKLRKLGVLLPGREEDIKDLRQAISKMGKRLHSLSIWINAPCADGVSLDKEDGDGTFLPPVNLESLSIAGMDKSGLPSWVDEGLKQLSKITLCNTPLTHTKLETLSKLTGLLCLRLHHVSFTKEELAFRADGFIALKFLLLESATTTKLTFEENSGPKLEKIVWSMPSDASFVTTVSATGIEHLAGLKQVVLKGPSEGDSCPLVEEAITKHPRHQAIEIIIGDWNIVPVTSTT